MGNLSSKHLVAGGVASAVVIGSAGLFYYMSQKDSGASAEKVQNLSDEQILNILEDLRVEFTPTLIHWFQVFTQLQQQGNQYNPEKALAYIKDKVEMQCSEIEVEICKKHNISQEELRAIISSDSSNEKIQNLNEVILTAIEATSAGKRPELKLEIPDALTKETYLKVYRRLLMGIRHNHYMKIRESVRSNGGSFDKSIIKELGKAESNEEIRGKVFEFYGIPKVEGEDYHRTLKKAFYLYFEDKSFQRRVELLQKANHEILQKIISGEVLPEVEKDPFGFDDEAMDKEEHEIADKRIAQFEELLKRFSQQGAPPQAGAHQAHPLFQQIEDPEQKKQGDEAKVEEVGGGDNDDDDDYEDVEEEGDDQDNSSLPRRKDEEGEDKKPEEEEAKVEQEKPAEKPQEPVKPEGAKKPEPEEAKKPEPEEVKKVEPEPKKAELSPVKPAEVPKKEEKPASSPVKPESPSPKKEAVADAFDVPEPDAFDAPQPDAFEGDAFDEPAAAAKEKEKEKVKVEADAFEGDAFDNN